MLHCFSRTERNTDLIEYNKKVSYFSQTSWSTRRWTMHIDQFRQPPSTWMNCSFQKMYTISLDQQRISTIEQFTKHCTSIEAFQDTIVFLTVVKRSISPWRDTQFSLHKFSTALHSDERYLWGFEDTTHTFANLKVGRQIFYGFPLFLLHFLLLSMPWNRIATLSNLWMWNTTG